MIDYDEAGKLILLSRSIQLIYDIINIHYSQI